MENRTLIFIVLLVIVPNINTSAQAFKPISIGLEFQAYPAGYIAGLRGDFGFGTNWTGNSRVGYNFARRRDLGEHDEEKGGGPGISLGTRYYFKEMYGGIFIGLRSDLWFLNIDWEDEVPDSDPRTGTTDITVLQPMGEGGYAFILKKHNLSLSLYISLGFEINVRTTGEAVGEGPISLLGFTFDKRF